MHQEAYTYVQQAVYGIDMSDKRVLEIGSYDVNGSVRPIFDGAAEYVGIDKRPGPGVDQVTDARKYQGKDFDIVVSSEAIEHDEKPQEVLQAAKKFLKPGGVLILTTSGPERAPHKWNGDPNHGEEPYQNFSAKTLKNWLKDWDRVDILGGRDGQDVYVTAYAPKEEPKPVAKAITKKS